MRFLASKTQCAEDENRIISGYVGRHFRHSAHPLEAGVGLAGAQLTEQRASGTPREALHGMVSHHGGTHSFQCLLLPYRRVDRAQPAVGALKSRDARSVECGRRFQHGARDLWATCHTCEIARSVGQASCTHLQTWSVGSVL